eukprot:TRINITY_DN34059_c0_g1_i1.p1 TRINITY_DN34059_c0_g1~~TRINITY_DN34059_c0_g1_i1.p1  ORF type:complete len:147 (-),score=13.84 TRINITY_DN34059_c0_g1_i1:376-750(-)
MHRASLCPELNRESVLELSEAFEHKGIKRLSPDQLSTFLRRIGVRLTGRQLGSIIQQVGADKNGHVAAADFCDWLLTYSDANRVGAATEMNSDSTSREERSYTLLTNVSFYASNDASISDADRP